MDERTHARTHARTHTHLARRAEAKGLALIHAVDLRKRWGGERERERERDRSKVIRIFQSKWSNQHSSPMSGQIVERLNSDLVESLSGQNTSGQSDEWSNLRLVKSMSGRIDEWSNRSAVRQ